jgi:segregation and condensation protein B
MSSLGVKQRRGMADPNDRTDMSGMEPDEANAAPGLGPVYAALLNSRAWQQDSAETDGVEPTPISAQFTPSINQEASPSGEGNMQKAWNSGNSSNAAPAPLDRIVEALLFVGGGPLTAEQACAAVPGITCADFLRNLDMLNHSYRIQGRPYFIRVSSKACELVLRPKFRPLVEKMYGASREARLSTAALDVLSVVAYRQPLTKQEIDGMRGAESGAVLRQLVRHGLLTVAHMEHEGKSEPVYRTTRRFIEFFQLRGLEDLPQTQDLQRL